MAIHSPFPKSFCVLPCLFALQKKFHVSFECVFIVIYFEYFQLKVTINKAKTTSSMPSTRNKYRLKQGALIVMSALSVMLVDKSREVPLACAPFYIGHFEKRSNK